MSAARGHSRAISARLLLAASFVAAPVAAQQTGSVFGTVRSGGAPLQNARAVLDTARELRTDSAGRFQFRDVAAGRHTLSVLALGMTPYSVNLIVPAGDTLDFEVVLVKSVVLDSVIVEGSTVRQGFARAYEDRKRVGLGKYMDSLEVRKFGVIRQALLFIPGVRCEKACENVMFRNSMGALCLPNVWIDNQNWGIDQGVIRTTRPDDIMGIEVYTREALMPDEFKQRGLDRGCGALVIWTRRLWPQGKGKPN